MTLRSTLLSTIYATFLLHWATGANSAELVADMESLEGWRSKPNGLTLQGKHFKEGAQAAEFPLFAGNIASKTGFSPDWTPYSALVFWAYSERPGEGIFGLSLTTLREDETGWNYFLLPIKVDWSGWKRFVIPRESFRKVRNPDWSQIHVLKFSLEWEGRTLAAPEQSVIIDTIRLMTRDEVESLSDEEGKAQ